MKVAIITDWKDRANLPVAVDENTEVIECAIYGRKDKVDNLISNWVSSLIRQ